jgi:hypothetical protein
MEGNPSNKSLQLTALTLRERSNSALQNIEFAFDAGRQLNSMLPEIKICSVRIDLARKLKGRKKDIYNGLRRRRARYPITK